LLVDDELADVVLYDLGYGLLVLLDLQQASTATALVLQ
jgi:hypothetical protein